MERDKRMSQTKEGAKKVAITNKSKYGEDYYAKIGKLGGRAGKGHKFAHGKIDPREAGKLSKPYSLKPKQENDINIPPKKRFWGLF
jgi:hypothetical protein